MVFRRLITSTFSVISDVVVTIQKNLGLGYFHPPRDYYVTTTYDAIGQSQVMWGCPKSPPPKHGNLSRHNIYEAVNGNFSFLTLQTHYFLSSNFPCVKTYYWQIPCVFPVGKNGLPNSLFSLCGGKPASTSVILNYLIRQG